MTEKIMSPKPPVIDFKLLLLVILFSVPIPIFSWLTSVGIQSRISTTYENTIVELIQKEKGIDIGKQPEVLEKFNLNSRCSDYNETSSYVKQLCSTKNDVSNLETISILFFNSLICRAADIPKSNKKKHKKPLKISYTKT